MPLTAETVKTLLDNPKKFEKTVGSWTQGWTSSPDQLQKFIEGVSLTLEAMQGKASTDPGAVLDLLSLVVARRSDGEMPFTHLVAIDERRMPGTTDTNSIACCIKKIDWVFLKGMRLLVRTTL